MDTVESELPKFDRWIFSVFNFQKFRRKYKMFVFSNFEKILGRKFGYF